VEVENFHDARAFAGRLWPATISATNKWEHSSVPNHIFQLDRLLADTLPQFIADIHKVKWRGKERDCVNLFAMGYLIDACIKKNYPFLTHPTQIGIEMPVGKPRRLGTRKSLSKDLVIWRDPWTNCWGPGWNPTRSPLAVIEWKVTRGSKGGKNAGHEKTWLSAFARSNPKSVGYAVSLRSDGVNPEYQITVARFFRREYAPEWLTG
jgi:hypothetical protein